MKVRLTNLKYVTLRRIGSGNCPESLEVPSLVVERIITPQSLVAQVNDLEFCDIQGNELVTNPQRTREERRRLIQHSPRIIGLTRGGKTNLYQRSNSLEELVYVSLNGEKVKPQNPRDYVQGAVASARYLGIPFEKLQGLVRRKRLGYYRVEQSGVPRVISPKVAYFYLLGELNRLRGRREK